MIVENQISFYTDNFQLYNESMKIDKYSKILFQVS